MEVIGTIASGITNLIPGVGDAIKQWTRARFPDPVEADRANAELVTAINTTTVEQTKAFLALLTADAQSTSWLPRNGRWIILMVFTGLIVAAWFGFTPENMPTSMIDHLFSILAQSLGIMGGAAFAGRSVEKIADSISSRVLEYKLRR